MSGFRRQRPSRERGGISLLEVLLALGILAVALVPIITLFSNTHRMGHSARRLVDVTLHVQSLLEALAELEPADFPVVAPGETTTLMDDEGPVVRTGKPRYVEVCDFFAKPVPVDGMKRRVIASRQPPLPTGGGGELELRVEVTWDSVAGEERTQQKMVLPMLSAPRNWQ